MAQVVNTGSGRIRGMREGGVLAFLGVPFASPPIEALRFRPPHKPVPWADVRDACTYGPAAMQVANPVASQMGQVPSAVSEDCLYLNVWTPAADGAHRPVLVWLHGGAWVSGAGSLPLFNGARLAARGEDTSAPELWFAISGDHVWRYPVMRQAELHAGHTPQTYAYLFAWRSPALGG